MQPAFPPWLTLDQLKTGEHAQLCGPPEPGSPPTRNPRPRVVEPGDPVHVVMLDAEGRFAPLPTKVR